MITRIVFVTSHPIQYQVPVFRHLCGDKRIEFLVLFAMIPDAVEQGAGFGVKFQWDIPLLGGFRYRVLENVSKRPGVTHFRGCDTPEIFSVLRELDPDAVVVNGWVVKTCVQALWACKRLGVPCLVRGEANDLRPRAWWKRQLQRLLVHQYAATLYIGKANKAFYEARGVAADKLFPAPYCIENERFEKAAQSLRGRREALRQDWGIPAQAACFLFSGKFEDKKHPLELLKSFAEARAANQALHLLMVGDGALRARCEEFARGENLPVTFAGFLNQSEIVSAYVAADCLVLPSDAGETWGLVVNEAMACGLPALVSDQVGCGVDLVSAGETGRVFRFGDWAALAREMADLGKTKGELNQMGNNARRRVAAYSPGAAAEGITQAVRSLSMESVEKTK